MGQGMGALAPLLPLLGLAALIFTAVRRRKEKKERYAPKPRADKKEETDGRT